LFAPAEGAAPSKLRGWGEFVKWGQGGDSPLRVVGSAHGIEGFSFAEHMKLCVQSVVCYTSLKSCAFEKGFKTMSYSIIRMQKMKSGDIKGIQFHNQREKESKTNGDIDQGKTTLNYDLINGDRRIDYNEKIDLVISENVNSGKKIRKDAVRLTEFMITSDKDFFDGLPEKDHKRFFETAHEFLADRYGEKNLVYATVHNDEKTPHMHVGFVPVTEDGRLAAKDFFGQRKQLVSLQDDFNKYLKQNGFDLERGVSSDRKHLETAKLKALTFKEMEKEATKKYETTIQQIEKIEDDTKSIVDIETKKMLGRVHMKEEDYKALLNYAVNGVVAEVEAGNLKKDLKKAKQEVLQLKEQMQKGQDKLRANYVDVEKENEKIKENLESMALKKAEEKFKSIDAVKEYNELVGKYNNVLEEKKGLEDSKMKLWNEKSTLQFENESYKRENAELKRNNDLLKGQIEKIQQEFLLLKKRVVEVLNQQFKKIKTMLDVRLVDPKVIRSLEERKEKIIEESLEKINKQEPEKRKETGLER
jgi:hypothetical protein